MYLVYAQFMARADSESKLSYDGNTSTVLNSDPNCNLILMNFIGTHSNRIRECVEHESC